MWHLWQQSSSSSYLSWTHPRLPCIHLLLGTIIVNRTTYCSLLMVKFGLPGRCLWYTVAPTYYGRRSLPLIVWATHGSRIVIGFSRCADRWRTIQNRRKRSHTPTRYPIEWPQKKTKKNRKNMIVGICVRIEKIWQENTNEPTWLY